MTSNCPLIQPLRALHIGKACVFLLAVVTLSVGAEQADSELVAAERLVPYSEDSVARGARLFATNCTACHGRDGKALIDIVADATDLTEPVRWRNGIREQDIYRSLTEGAGYDMPPFKHQFPDKDDIWDLINWIISTWPSEDRAALLDQKK